METKRTTNHTTSEQKRYDEHYNSSNEPGSSRIVRLLSHLVSIPLFIIVHKLVPDVDWPIHLDRILLFLITVGIVEAILQSFSPLVKLAFIVAFGWLTYGSIWGNYGYGSLYQDYKFMIYTMYNSANPEKVMSEQLKPFPNKDEIIKAINYKDTTVRNFALQATRKHFHEYQKENEEDFFLQYCAVFKEINTEWSHVEDPVNTDSIVSASESVDSLSGDNQDYCILMASSIMSIGGKVRIARTTDRLFPLLFIGDDKKLDKVNYFIKEVLFEEESKSKEPNFYEDEDRNIWLNLDFYSKYPGDKSAARDLVAVLRLDREFQI